MRRAGRIVNKTAGRVIADPVIKKTRNHIDFFGPGFVKIDSFPAGARIQLNYLRHGSARGTPKSAHPDSSAELLLHRRIFNVGPFYFWHRPRSESKLSLAWLPAVGNLNATTRGWTLKLPLQAGP